MSASDKILTVKDLSNISGISNIEAVDCGGQKQVFKCTHAGEKTAIKFICIEKEINGIQIFDDTALKRIKRELETMNEIASPFLPSKSSLAPGYIEKEGNGFFYYGEEFIEGETVRNLIRKGLLNYMLVLRMAGDITHAVENLWLLQKVHRDIKPENIIFNNKSNNFVLIDTGIVFVLDETSLTPTGFTVGTLPYMSPEQVRGEKRQLDFRSDLFSLGIVLYEAITGEHPYFYPGQKRSDLIRDILQTPLNQLSQKCPSLEKDFCHIVDSLLKKRAHLRPRTFKILFENLTKLGYN